MTVTVGINGFGRIGRQVYKAIRDNYDGILDVVAVNDLVDVKTNAHLLSTIPPMDAFPARLKPEKATFMSMTTESGATRKETRLICHGKNSASISRWSALVFSVTAIRLQAT
jgi:glyceraldehyde-3-phosphate dehydrogenase/erythrose-4-phosphate dehydrogenase